MPWQRFQGFIKMRAHDIYRVLSILGTHYKRNVSACCRQRGSWPSESDKKVAKGRNVRIYRLAVRILSMALFAPGENGDEVHETTGFYCQPLGLSLMLGVIVQFDCARTVGGSFVPRNDSC